MENNLGSDDEQLQSSHSSSYKRGLTFDQGVRKTYKKKKDTTCLSRFFCCGAPFQVLFIITLTIYLLGLIPILFAIGFLETEPKHFECKNKDNEGWHSCNKEEICGNHLTPDEYRPDTNDDEYIDNWVSPNKMNLLCESKFKIGLFGSCYFLGELIAFIVVPPLADAYGRKLVVNLSLALSIAA